MQAPFWQTKTLAQLSEREWESLCDGCGKCCLHKLEDEDTGRVHLTVVACRQLELESCRCRHYEQRFARVPGCVRVRPDNVRTLALPPSCAYRRVAEGRELPSWHPLISGDPQSTLREGASVRGFAIAEDQVAEDELEDFIFQELAPASSLPDA